MLEALSRIFRLSRKSRRTPLCGGCARERDTVARLYANQVALFRAAGDRRSVTPLVTFQPCLRCLRRGAA